MNKPIVRTHKSRGVSLPREIDERVSKRLEGLKPRVKGFSHYVQMLVDWDLRRAEMEPAQPGKDALPFNNAQLLFAELLAA